MRICIFGAGSLGSALGGMLSAKNEVVLIGRRLQVDAVNNGGLRLSGDVVRRTSMRARLSIKGLNAPDLLIVTTKSYDTREAVAECKRWASGSTKVLTLQNGLGNLELLRDWKGELAFGGTTTMGAALISPGNVRVSGLGKTTIGADLDLGGAREIAEAFSLCGVPSAVERDVKSAIWSKAVVSACINPLTAVLRVRNGRLLESPVISRLMADVCRECVEVAGSEGIELSFRSLIARVRAVAEDTSENRSSMLQDVERSRRTEIDYINGMFWQLGARNRIPTPLNMTLAAMVGALEPRPRTQKG